MGRPKVESAADSVAHPVPRDDRHRAPRIAFTRRRPPNCSPDADILIDGSDTNETRFAANDAAVAAGIPLVWGSALRCSGQVGIAWGGTRLPRPVPRRARLRSRHLRDRRHPAERLHRDRRADGDRGDQAAHGHRRAADRAGRPLRRARPAPPARCATRAIRRGMPHLDVAAAPRDAASDRSMSARELADLLNDAHEERPVLLDVREPYEVELASLPGAMTIPLGELDARLGELDPDGRRSSTATSASARRRRSRAWRLRDSPGCATSPAASTRGRARSTRRCRGTEPSPTRY